MSDVVVTPPFVRASARAHLAGRPVHVRASRRHGCCGGTAAVPVAEPGKPEDLDGTRRFEVEGTVVYVDRTVFAADGTWTIDTDGFARWRRLVVLGVELTPG
ncbi:MAG TPA: CC/Se motif family (seleno)protein [Ilumatobacteraceae bacterium]|nr:CC/Se motif family (seleno)protein [Ilumatobacteraceae bacterium]